MELEVSHVDYEAMAKSLQYQVLAHALELLSDERSWTRGALARTASNRACLHTDPAAVKFCAIGALHRAVLDLTGRVDYALSKEVVRRVGSYVALPYINDFQGREAVIGLFKKALGQV